MKFIKVALISTVFAISSFANAGLILNNSPLVTTNLDEVNTTFNNASGTTIVGSNYTFQDVGGQPGFCNYPTQDYLYQCGGTDGYIEISTNNGVDLIGLQFNVANGWSASSQYIWLQAYSDGNYTGFEIDVDLTQFDLLSVSATGNTTFDTIRLWVTSSSSSRDTHNQNLYAAGSISNVQGVMTSVPEPSTLAIFALGMIGLASRRFKKQS